MKISLINFSGNVGKTTLARHLFLPRLPSAIIIPVETINADGTEKDIIKGKEYKKLQETLALADNAVVDVGSSNVEDLIALMKQYRGSHEDFDLFIVPTVPKAKQMQDTAKTLAALTEIGVPPQRLRVLFNMLEFGDDPETVFAPLFDLHRESRCFTLIPNAVLYMNDIYSRLTATDLTIEAILGDKTDFKAKIAAAKAPADKLAYAQQQSLQRLALGVKEDLDSVFETIIEDL